jgi:hypothetical protein
MHSFVQLEEGTQQQRANNSWDIAFNVKDGEAGVFINESVGSAAGALPIQSFYTFSTDFSATPDPLAYEETPLFNAEKTWSYGAFNEIRNVEDPDDFGWGYRNPENQEVTGENVFVVRLRDGSDLKIQIQSLIGGVYTFRYANLDGTGAVVEMINKADHAGKLLAYYSFTTQDVVDIEPAGSFDLLFTRYFTLLDPGNGELVEYLVTGIISGDGVEVAQADGVDPKSVMFADYQQALSTDIETIGQDWKFFDLDAFQWIIIEDRVYFVRTADDRVWKIQFTGFGGSSNGNATFQKTDLGIIAGVKAVQSPFASIDVFPNPTQSRFDVLFSLKENPEPGAQLRLMDVNGRILSQESILVGQGLNVHSHSVEGLPGGIYYLSIAVKDYTMLRKVVVVQ